MTDELVKRLRGDWCGYEVSLKAIDAMTEAADRIEQLTAELQVSNELGKALEEDAGQLREENAKLTADKRFILEERDRTFALMLARAEAAEAERDRLREALTMIDAIDPEHRIDGCAQTVVRGLVLRMGETARAALKGESHD